MSVTTLWNTTEGGVERPFFQISSLEQFTDEAKKSSIMDLLGQDVDQHIMRKMESRWGAWPAFRRVGFPTALPRTGRATLAASGSPGWPGGIAGASAGDGRCGTSRSFGPDTPLALGWSCSSRQCNGALLRRGWRIGRSDPLAVPALPCVARGYVLP